MKLELRAGLSAKPQKNCQVVGIYEGGQLSESAKQIDQNEGLIAPLLAHKHFQGKIGEILPLFHKNHTLLLVGCGKKNALSPTSFKKIIIQTIKTLNQLQIDSATCYFSELDVNEHTLAWKVKQIALMSLEGMYRFDLFKSQKEPALSLKEFIIALPDHKQLKDCQIALKQGEATAKGMELTKNLANLPSNICTPTFLAEQAKELGRTHSAISVKVLNEKAMQKLGMGALLAVSQGSAEEAQFICLEYKGSTKKAPIALVGKGITFDTGGNSLKTPDSMVGMKYDMCGAATVLGTFKAAALLKLPIHLVGIIPAVENMPGGTAYKPEDILTSLSGQTIEVISTDAEGRLILADALTYCERYKPEVVIDIATLTGAVVIGLGYHATGLMSNHEALAKALIQAGVESHDRVWQLPLWEEYQEQIKSPFADMANTGGRSAGTITAGCFLSRFSKKFHWAHLDVAGTAAMMGGTLERQATGRPVPLLTQYLIDRSLNK